MVWQPGDTLQDGKYTIERELGRGRFGITYLAKHESGELLVIKSLNDTVLASLSSALEKEKLEVEFIQEATKLAKCQHPNIVKAGMPFKEQGKYCIAMEYIDGFSLAERAQRVVLEEVALRYIQEIGEALIAVHQSNLIHRDVKPGNILLRPCGNKTEAVLIDFGLALELNRDLTTVRTEQASEGFAPPELYSRHAEKTGPYTDIYSLAATLYDLLTGRAPISAIERKLGHVILTPPIGLNHQISPQVSEAIMKAMELNPKDRPKSMSEWLVLLGLTIHTTSELPPPPVKEPQLGSPVWVIGTIIAAIAALGTFLSGLAGWIPVFKPSPSPTSSSSPIITPNSLPSSTPQRN